MVLLKHVTVCDRFVKETQRSCASFAFDTFFGLYTTPSGQGDGQFFSLTLGRTQNNRRNTSYVHGAVAVCFEEPGIEHPAFSAVDTPARMPRKVLPTLLSRLTTGDTRGRQQHIRTGDMPSWQRLQCILTASSGYCRSTAWSSAMSSCSAWPHLGIFDLAPCVDATISDPFAAAFSHQSVKAVKY